MMTGRKMNVLIVYHHLPHYRYDVFRSLEDQEDLEVEFAAAATSRDGSIETIPGVALRSMHELNNLWLGPFLWQRGLLRLLVQRRFDAVIFLGDAKHLSSWLGALLSRLSGAAVLFWTIGWFRPETGAHRLYKMTFYRLAHSLLIYGNAGKRLGVAMGYPARRMTVVFNGSSSPIVAAHVDAEQLARFEDALPPEGEQVLGAVLRLNIEKELTLLIDACAALRAAGRDTSVLLVGRGPDRQRLVDRAHALGVPLWLPGPAYSDAELDLVYRRILVTVIPSAAGLSVLQSFKYGRPVITHDRVSDQMPEFEAIVPNVTGDLYRRGDQESLIAQIDRWLDRQSQHSAETAVQCRRVLELDWNPYSQARTISAELRKTVARSRAARRATPRADSRPGSRGSAADANTVH